MSKFLFEAEKKTFRSLRQWGVRIIAVLLVLILMSGCATLIRPPQDDQAARSLVENLIFQNPDLSQFKGMLRLRLQTGNQRFSGRAAWATAMPDRFRIELLNMLGQPLTSLAGDGSSLTMMSYTDQSFYRLRQTRTALDKLVQIPIGIRDLNQLLAGRPPLPEFEAVQVSDGKPEEGATIIFKSRWHHTLAQLCLDDSGQMRMMKAFAPDGTLRYRVHWLEWQVISGVNVPRQMQLEAPEGKHLKIIIERFWPNVQLEPGIFQIADPKLALGPKKNKLPNLACL
jgi:outer membrane biogenesis lipoprotein LolB